VNTPVHFRQQLADELTARATSLSAPAGHSVLVRLRRPVRRMPLALGAAAAAVAAVAVAVPLTSGSHSAPRAAASTGPAPSSAAPTAHGTASAGLDVVNADYAVKSAPGGTVSVQLFTPRGAAGLQADLRRAGIPAAVLTPSASCHATIREDRSGRSNVVKVMPPTGTRRGSDGAISHLIDPSAIPEGDHLLFIAHFAPGQAQGLGVALVREIPSCVS
jgi:hypothetical protein